MPKAGEEQPRWMQAKQAFAWCRGARPVEYRKVIVRDRHTGQLAEVPLTEAEPLDPGDEGETFVFAKGEKVLSDHPAVVAKPMYFIEAAPEYVAVERA